MMALVTIRMVVLAAVHSLCLLSHCLGMAANRENMPVYSLSAVVVVFVHSKSFSSGDNKKSIASFLSKIQQELCVLHLTYLKMSCGCQE